MFEFHAGDVKHFAAWGKTGEGMSVSTDKPAPRAAYVSGGIMLINAEEKTLPPGFERFLTDAECRAEGVPGYAGNK